MTAPFSRMFAVRRRGGLVAALLGSTATGLPGAVRAQDVAADGRTPTAVATTGAVTEVTGGTVHGGLGFNSFSTLSVGAGHSVNIHAPAGTGGTVNIVRDRASVIDGALTGMVGGAAGGTLVIANPHGIVVGAGGQVSGGSVTLTTPDAGFVAGFFGPDGRPAAGRAEALLDGSAPRAAGADVVVDGGVTGTEGVTLRAGRDVIVGTTTAAGRAAAVSAVANTGARRAIVLDAGRDVAVRGSVTARTGDAGGSVTLRAGRDATVSGTLDAGGRGDGAGGSIGLLAERAAWLTATGSVLADAPGAGDGGRIVFSGLSTVRLDGRLTAAAAAPGAAPGDVVIDPEEIVISTDQWWVGQNVTLDASARIELRPGVILSTRTASNRAAALQPFTTPTGRANNLTLRAPVIEIGEQAQILATGGTGADGTVFAGGAIHLDARSVVTTPGILTLGSEARIGIAPGVVILGDSVTIEAVAESTLRATTLRDLVEIGTAGLPPLVADFVQKQVDAIINGIDRLPGEFLPVIVTADARVSTAADRIEALAGRVVITARASTDVTVASDDAILSAVAVQTGTFADVDLQSSSQFFNNIGSVQRGQRIAASDLVVIEAITHEAQRLVAQAGNGPVDEGQAFLLSNRQQRARVRWLRGAVDTIFGPAVGIEGDTLIRARAVRDLSLRAAASGDGIAGAIVLSTQNAPVDPALFQGPIPPKLMPALLDPNLPTGTSVEGAGGISTGGRGGVTIEATTRYDRLDVSAEAFQGPAPAGAAPPPPAAAPSHPQAAKRQALLHIAAALGNVATVAQQVGIDLAAEIAQDPGIAGVVLRHNDDTRVDASGSGIGRITLTPPDYDYASPPPPAAPLVISARTETAAADVRAEVVAPGSQAPLIPVVFADLASETTANLGYDVETSGNITVAARTAMPGWNEAPAAAAAGLLPLAPDGSGLADGAALPPLSGLLTPSRAAFSTRAEGAAGAPARLVTLLAEVGGTQRALAVGGAAPGSARPGVDPRADNAAVAVGAGGRTAGVALDRTTLETPGAVTLDAQAAGRADIPGLITAAAAVEARDSTLTAGTGMQVRATGTVEVEAESAEGSARGAAARANDEETAAEIDTAADAAIDGSAAARQAFALAFAPQAGQATADIALTRTTATATGDIIVAAQGETGATLGAETEGLAVALAATETAATVTVRDSRLESAGVVSLGALTVERHDLTARRPADDGKRNRHGRRRVAAPVADGRAGGQPRGGDGPVRHGGERVGAGRPAPDLRCADPGGRGAPRRGGGIFLRTGYGGRGRGRDGRGRPARHRRAGGERPVGDDRSDGRRRYRGPPALGDAARPRPDRCGAAPRRRPGRGARAADGRGGGDGRPRG
jgi:filamentous hemagglutinin family protein